MHNNHLTRLTRRLCGLVLGMLLLPAFANAWTLPELQQNAASHRYLVRDYQAALSEQQQQLRNRRGAFLPAVDLYYQAQQQRDATLYDPRQGHSRGAQLSWNLFNGFGDYYRLLSQQQQQQVARLHLEEIQQSVQEQVAQTCLLLHQQILNLEVAQRAVQLYQQEQHNAAAKFSVGLMTRNDVLKIEVELENSRLAVNRAGTAIQQHLAELQRQTLSNVQLQTVDLHAFDTLPAAGDEAVLQQQLEQNNRELLALRTVLAAANLEHKAARDAFLPKADVIADYRRDEDALLADDGDRRDEQLSAQLRISINLFDGFKDDANLQTARLAAERARYRYHEREHELRTALANARRDYALAVDNLQVAQTNHRQAVENQRITKLALDQGLTTSAELLDAIFYQTRAEFNIIEARAAIFSADFTIQQLTGAYPQYSLDNQ